jgi:hypothetical protein
MLRTPAPMSNVERQQLFRKRHPGYFRRYKMSRRAVEEARATSAAALAAAQSLPAPAPLVSPDGKTQEQSGG